ncbi:hypothetical protein NC653_016033 [Populus alba x Populus x berolinensis]|uniref:Uncharacterized protein n=1 Tax=Populus alba x Populus x berolinensis TaxID=444605 RepID=A0AAD6VYR8_9ROSI|nr:hypothetical protein NC653_016033 [Populus alba x Populus x berolinensis]
MALSDKKNENKEVAVNDFLPASDAYEAIQHSIGEPQAIDAPAHKNDRPMLEVVYDDDDYVRVARSTVVINSEETRKRNSGVGLNS